MMSVELRVSARYRLVDRMVVAERIGSGWWLLQSVVSAGGLQLTWAIAPDGRIYQGSVEALQDTNLATFRPLGPVTDLTADDLHLLSDGPYGDGDIDQANRRTLS
ncbi:MAG: hypothetical protein HC822_17320 [Oscillochloris sp.]|nr:hypothetical protein [Oscillochloris sp.]